MSAQDSEFKAAARAVSTLETIAAGLDGDNRLGQALASFADTLASEYRLPARDARRPVAILDAAHIELLDRLAETGKRPFEDQDERGGAILTRGLQFTLDDARARARLSVAEYMPQADGRPKVFLARSFMACGLIEGGIATTLAS